MKDLVAISKDEVVATAKKYAAAEIAFHKHPAVTPLVEAKDELLAAVTLLEQRERQKVEIERRDVSEYE